MIVKLPSSLTLLAILLLLTLCSCIHLQKFGPSTPNGVYQGTNNTASSTTNAATSNSTINNSNNTASIPANVAPMVNGKPYVYTGPFTLVCYYKNSDKIYRYDSCYGQDQCSSMIREYFRCEGKVMKYNVVQ